MQDEKKVTENELMQYAAHMDAALRALVTLLPHDMRITIIVRKENDSHGIELAGALIRSNDEIQKMLKILIPMTKAVDANP